MNRTILFATAGFAALFAASTFAGEAEHKDHMLSKLAQDSSPANVKAVALQQKTAYCEKNAKNKALQGSERESYINTCMNHDEAHEKLALTNRGSTHVASTDINHALRESPTGAGHK